jgi:hypothetical protein
LAKTDGAPKLIGKENGYLEAGEKIVRDTDAWKFDPAGCQGPTWTTEPTEKKDKYYTRINKVPK